MWCGLVSLVGSCIVFGDFPPLKVSILAFFILEENITAIQLAGGVLILIGVGLALRSEFKSQKLSLLTG